MNAPLDLSMDKKTFLRWAARQEGRYELIGGRPVMQHSPTRGHGIIAKNLGSALERRLDPSAWLVLRGDLSVEIGEETRIPDVLVEPAGLDRASQTTSEPVLLAEVLSPSSAYADMSSKPSLYFSLPSLEIYIVLSQESPYAWVWQRSRDAARAFPQSPHEIDDPLGVIAIASLGIEVPLAEIFRGVGSGLGRGA